MRVAIAVLILATLAGPGGAAATEVEEIGRPPAAWEHMPADIVEGRQAAERRAELARREVDALSRRQAELKAFQGGCPVDGGATDDGGFDPNAIGRRYGALILLLTPPAAFLGLLALQHRRHHRAQASR